MVDCSAVTSFADFISAFNAGFCSLIDGEWSGNMDAFDDYLSWPTEPQYTLRILSSNTCREALGHQAYVGWLEDVLEKCHPSNRTAIRRRLNDARLGDGPTLFDFLLEIVHSNPHVSLELA